MKWLYGSLFEILPKLMRNIFDDDEVYKSNQNSMLDCNKSEILKQQNSSKLNSNLFEDL